MQEQAQSDKSQGGLGDSVTQRHPLPPRFRPLSPSSINLPANFAINYRERSQNTRLNAIIAAKHKTNMDEVESKPRDRGTLTLGALALARELRCPAEEIDWEMLREAYPAGYQAFLGEEAQKAEQAAIRAAEQAEDNRKLQAARAKREAFLRKVDACAAKPAVKLRLRLMANKYIYIQELLAYPEDGIVRFNNPYSSHGYSRDFAGYLPYKLDSWRYELQTDPFRLHAPATDPRRSFKSSLLNLFAGDIELPMPERDADVYYLNKMELAGEHLVLRAYRDFASPAASKLWYTAQEKEFFAAEVDPEIIKAAIAGVQDNPCYTITGKKDLRPLVSRYNKLFPEAPASTMEEVLRNLKSDTTI